MPEYYNSPTELLAEDDLVETDIKVGGWKKHFRIRALTFEQMDDINMKALDPKTNTLRQKEWVYWTIVHGVVRPAFKIEQARMLGASNGEFVKELADNIWEIGRLDKTVWDNFIAESERANKVDSDDIKGMEPNDE